MDLSVALQTCRKNLIDLVRDYAYEHHRQDLMDILRAHKPDVHYSLIFHFVLLLESCPKACKGILANSCHCFPLYDTALVQAAKKLYESVSEDERKHLKPKKHIHFRVTGMPSMPEINRSTIPRSKDCGQFLTLQGTVIRSSMVRMIEYQREYRCAKCGEEFIVKADYEQYYGILAPTKCPKMSCKSTSFKKTEESGPVYGRDYQEIKIQEQIQKQVLGMVPKSIWVTLEDDLVDTCKPGDDIIICGTVKRRWQPLVRDEKISLDVVIRGNYLQVTNKVKVTSAISEELEQEFQHFWSQYGTRRLVGRDIILSSFCPEIYGLYLVKLAAAIILAGGVSRLDESGTKVRGESHLLLVGDPGAGKSQILKHVCKLSTRSVLTTGIGTTSAGLTVTAVKDAGNWHLEAGALVLADGGICCIDEFSSIRNQDRQSILEAMEQQTISVAKAGLVCNLKTRCSVIAATNAKGGHYDPSHNLEVNSGLSTPLLSRFDLILVLLDSKDQAWDEIVASHILNDASLSNHQQVDGQSTDRWSSDKLRSYFNHIKNLKPTLTDEANQILRHYYYAQRQASERNSSRTTVRMYESMIRLAQGHARLMYRSKVTIQDAIVVVTLMESSMMSAALISSENALHSSFPEDPIVDYEHQTEAILTRLGLEEMLADFRQGNIEEQVADPYTQSDNIITNVPKNRFSREQIVQTQRMLENIRRQTARVDAVHNKAHQVYGKIDSDEDEGNELAEREDEERTSIDCVGPNVERTGAKGRGRCQEKRRDKRKSDDDFDAIDNFARAGKKKRTQLVGREDCPTETAGGHSATSEQSDGMKKLDSRSLRKQTTTVADRLAKFRHTDDDDADDDIFQVPRFISPPVSSSQSLHIEPVGCSTPACRPDAAPDCPDSLASQIPRDQSQPSLASNPAKTLFRFSQPFQDDDEFDL